MTDLVGRIRRDDPVPSPADVTALARVLCGDVSPCLMHLAHAHVALTLQLRRAARICAA